jgi:iron complex outermembrane receptor protein
MLSTGKAETGIYLNPHCRTSFGPRRLKLRGTLNSAAALLMFRGRHRRGTKLVLAVALLLSCLAAVAQVVTQTGQITGTVKDPAGAVIAGANVVLKDSEGRATASAVSNSDGTYAFPSVQPGSYVVEVEAKGFRHIASPALEVGAGRSATFDCALSLAERSESVTVSANVENAYRVDTVSTGGPLSTTPIVNLPYTVNVISRELIDDTQSRNFKEAVKYLPLAFFQEMQGPEVLRPETRGMQGSNMQNDRRDGMGFAVTTPSALEEFEQIEVVDGLGGPMYGPANPSGMFNFITKRPTESPVREIELDYEGSTVGTIHIDLGDRIGKRKIFGYRTNLVLADGAGYVTGSELRRQLAAVAADVHPSARTVIEGNYSYYNLFQHGYPGWFAYSPTTTPLWVAGSRSILLPANAPDPTTQGYGQSFSGVDLTSQIGELRLKHEFNANWHFVISGLDQLSDRNINTGVNQLIDDKGDYKSYFANTFSSLAPRFRVYSDLAYLTGRFETGRVAHDVVIGSTGYRFATYSPIATFPKTALCTSYDPGGVCQANIADPLVYLVPPTGVPSYAKTGTSTGIYGSSIIRQQGFNLADTITLSRHWLVRLAGSQDWTWTDSYTDSAATKYVKTILPGGYLNQGVSPSASILFKPRDNMTIYGTFAQSLQVPDVAGANSGSTVIVNASQPLAPYRSKEGEIGYKVKVRRLSFSADVFRIDRPFANYVTGVINPACGTQSGTANCEQYEITGTQRNYGAETMLSGRILPSLMITGGLVVLDSRLTDTGIAATNNRHFVGMPDFKSNILAEYHLPVLTNLFLNFDWQHLGRRPIDDINSAYTPQYNIVDVGFRYTRRIREKLVSTWRITANNISDVHYWSTLGPGSITGQSTGSYLGHLGEPRLVTASLRMDF